MATNVPFDYQGEQAELQHRMRVAEAMMQGGLAPMGPTEVVGGYAVKQSPLAGLSKVLQAYLGAKGVQSVSEGQRALGEKYRGEMKSGLERFFNTMEGSQTKMPGGDGTDAYGGTVEHKADPRRAVIEAMASQFPGLQQVGESYMKNMNQGQLTAKDLANLATPESVLSNPTNTAGWKPKRDLKSVQPGEVLLDAGGNVTAPGGGSGLPPQAPGNATSPGAISGPGWTTVKIGDDLYQQTSTGLKKLDNAPKVTTTVSPRIDVRVAGQKAGFEKWAESAAKTVTELSDSARQSVKLMTQLNQLEALTKGGTAAGPTADAAIFLQGLAKTAGIPVDESKLSNSQAFNSVATQAWAALMQQNGGARGLVKEESEKLAASLPSLVQTPAGRAQITAVLRQAAQQNIADAQKANTEFSKALQQQDPGQFTYGLSSTQLPQSPPQGPAPGAVAPGKKPSVSNW